jgi:hypothetical protein
MQKRWKILPANETSIAKLQADLNINKSQLKTISNGNIFSSNNHFGVIIEL